MYDIRLWGISGLFGHIGWFWSLGSGKYFALVKNGDNMFVIETYDNKRYVVSCDNPSKAMERLNSFLTKEKKGICNH